MLEFSEKFLKAEVREDFYIGKTMKAVWAAQLEVLQAIAEVCDRHHLTWYAAYGTLLGAVRHQGFIPWDDDVDIMMLRSDFMKLLKVLPGELPEGYRVRHAFLEEGVTRYQITVENSTSLHTAPEWMERFHGCPFIVAIDIFPLDYLPRNESERDIQYELFDMARQVIWYAEEGEKTEENLAEMNGYLDVIEEVCNMKIDRSFIREERWSDIIQPMWKLANQIAMMYGEEDGDELTMFTDYIRWPNKVFPKEWFQEVIALPFEDFALPAPVGYDGFLRLAYGKYHVRIKNIGMHGYPFYTNQLLNLQRYLVEHQNALQGDKPLMQLERIVNRQNGRRKKIVLYVNDIVMLIRYGSVALDKIECVLNTFRKAKEDIVLWWKPAPAALYILKILETDQQIRYNKIVEQYLDEGWGVYDDTSDMNEALQECSAYYGDLTPMIEKFQSTGRPVMIQDIELLFT